MRVSSQDYLFTTDASQLFPGKGWGTDVLWMNPMYVMSARITGSTTPAFSKTIPDRPEVIIANIV
jgi:hypothetical protein